MLDRLAFLLMDLVSWWDQDAWKWSKMERRYIQTTIYRPVAWGDRFCGDMCWDYGEPVGEAPQWRQCWDGWCPGRYV